MNITVGQKDFSNRLNLLHGLGTTDHGENAGSYCLIRTLKNGKASIAVSSGTTIAEMPLPLVAMTAYGNVCLPMRQVLNSIKGMAGIIHIFMEAETTTIDGHGRSFHLGHLDDAQIPPVLSWGTSDMGKICFSMDCSKFKAAIESVIFAAGKSDPRYTINSVLFYFAAPGLILVATNGNQMAIRKLHITVEPQGLDRCIVPTETLKQILKMLPAGGTVTVSFLADKTGTYIRFNMHSNGQVFGKLVAGTYPKYEVIPTGNSVCITADRDELVEALRRVSFVSAERGHAVKVAVTPTGHSAGILEIRASNPDLGEARDEVDIEYSGTTFEVGFNAEYLAEGLGQLGRKAVLAFNEDVLEKKETLSPVLITSGGGNEDYLQVLMPMRI